MTCLIPTAAAWVWTGEAARSIRVPHASELLVSMHINPHINKSLETALLALAQAAIQELLK